MIHHEVRGNEQLVLDYDDFCVWFDPEKGEYFYDDFTEDKDFKPIKVELIARLSFPSGILTAARKESPDYDKVLPLLFNADITGEAQDDSFDYLWFSFKEEHEDTIAL